jgi:hypothetical protein
MGAGAEVDYSDLPKGAKVLSAGADVAQYSDLPAGAKVLPATPQAPQFSVSAQHEPDSLAGKVTQWASDLGNDLRYGTENTMPGRVLQKMGARGLEAGTSPGTADFVGSVPLGAARMLKGGGELGQGELWQGGKDLAGGAFQASTIPNAFVAPEAREAMIGKVADVADSIPVRRLAGSAWAGAKGAAERIPIFGPVAKGGLRAAVRYWKNTAPAAEELESVGSQRLIETMGGKPVSAVTKPSGRMVLSEAESQAETQQMKLAKKLAQQRGMQYAAGMKPEN